MKSYFKKYLELILFCVFLSGANTGYSVDHCGGSFARKSGGAVVVKDLFDLRQKLMENLLHSVDFFSTAIRRQEFDSVTGYLNEILEFHNQLKLSTESSSSNYTSLPTLKEYITKLDRRISELDQQYEGLVQTGEQAETYRESIMNALEVLVEQSFDTLAQLKNRENAIRSHETIEQDGLLLQLEAKKLTDRLVLVTPLNQRISVLPLLIRLFAIYSEPALYVRGLQQLSDLQKNGRSREHYRDESKRMAMLPTEALQVGYSYYLSSGSLASLIILSVGVSRFPDHQVKKLVLKYSQNQRLNLDGTIELLIADWFRNFGSQSVLGNAVTKASGFIPEYPISSGVLDEAVSTYFPESIQVQVKAQLSRVMERGTSSDKKMYGHILQTWIRFRRSVH